MLDTSFTGNGTLSSVLGWISIACWIVVYSPQIYENYQLQSGEGVSLLFVAIWLLGDLFNLAGAVIGNLIPTIIILGAYYTACDLILLGQIYYYRWKRDKKYGESDGPEGLSAADDEQTPLIPHSAGLGLSATPDSVVQPLRVLLAKYALAVVFVISVGVGAWWVNEGRFRTTEPDVHGFSAFAYEEVKRKYDYLIQFFGWSSAALFLGARIPQILKNFHTRCAGLSPALFLFSILGNTTYCLSIVAKSVDKAYLVKNAGWLAGSGLTVFLDFFTLPMNNAGRYHTYDDESSYDFDSPLDSAPNSAYPFSPTDSTASGSSASMDEEDDEEDDDESYEEDSSDTTSPTATLSPQSPTFHPTGLTGPSLDRQTFPSCSPEQATGSKSYPMSYSSFSNYHPTAPKPGGNTAPRLQVPRPPRSRDVPNIPRPPPKPAAQPQPAAQREGSKHRVSQAPPPPPPRPATQSVPIHAPKPKVSFAPPPAPTPPPPPAPSPPPMARSKASAISHLREAIASIETQVASLLAQKRDLQSRLDREVRAQSPVHRLPSELLSSIFIKGVSGVNPEEGDEEEDNTVMLGTIMLVCKQWHQVALNTPRLWSKVNVSPHDSLARAKRRLERSMSSPLDIAINFGPRAEYTTTTTTYTTSTSSTTTSASASQSIAVTSSSASGSSVSYISTNPLILNGVSNGLNTNNVTANTKTTTTTVNVIDAIIRSMELFKHVLWRTRSLTLRVPNRHQAHAALMRCRDYPAPLLEHLTIHIYHSMLDGPSYMTTTSAGGVETLTSSKLTPLPLFAGQTPLLKTCSFTSFNFGWEATMVRRLRVLRFGGYFNGHAPTLPALLNILRECPELEELSLRNLSESDGDGNGSQYNGSNGSCDNARPGCGGHHALGGDVSTTTASASASAAAAMHSAASKTIVLPKLHSLTLYYASPAHSLLPLLSLPSLQNLTLAFLQNISSILQCLYTQALTRLPLRTMRIESCVFNEVTFVNLMRKLNGLLKLEMVDVEDLSGGALRSLTALNPNTPSPLPRVTDLTLDGCTSIDFDSLRIFVESRLPPNPHTFKRYHTTPKDIVSSASEAARLAEAAKQTRARHTTGAPTGSAGSDMILQPARLISVDVTRCTQISKEMVQWLRMYVAEVKCETAKGVWGDI